MKYIIGVYGPWGILDVKYVKLSPHGKVTYVESAKAASRFNTLARAGAYSKGFLASRAAEYGATIEPVEK